MINVNQAMLLCAALAVLGCSSAAPVPSRSEVVEDLAVAECTAAERCADRLDDCVATLRATFAGGPWTVGCLSDAARAAESDDDGTCHVLAMPECLPETFAAASEEPGVTP